MDLETLSKEYSEFLKEHLTEVHLEGFTSESLAKDENFLREFELLGRTTETFKICDAVKEQWRRDILPHLPKGKLDRYRDPNYGRKV
jgi:hypothetical protein